MLRPTLIRNLFNNGGRCQKQGMDYLLENMEPIQNKINNISPSEYLPSESFKLYHNYYPSNFNHKPSNFSKKYNSLSSESVILPDLNTLSLSTNLMTRYLTSMGKIKSKRQTGLSWKQQRKLGKAVRRGRQSGLLSTFAIGSNKKL